MALEIGGGITIGGSVSIVSTTTAVIVGGSTSPRLVAYQWTDSGGFGTKYADPSVLPAGTVFQVKFSPNRNAVAIATSTSPFVQAWAWYPTGEGGFGAKYSDPSTLPPSNGYAVAFSPAGDAVAVGHAGSPLVTVYPWNYLTGFGTKYADPGTLPSGISSRAVQFSPNGTVLAVLQTSGADISCYAWNSSTGFGSRYSDPSVAPNTGGGLSWHPSGQAIAILQAGTSTPFTDYTYAWSDSTGFGTRYTSANWSGSTGTDLAFTPDGSALFITYGANFTWAPFNLATGFGSVSSQNVPGADFQKPAFTYNSTTVFLPNLASTAGIRAYPWNINTGLGTVYSNPGTAPGLGYSVDVTL